MTHQIESSRNRFETYRTDFKNNPPEPGRAHSNRQPDSKKKRARSSLELIKRFWGLLRGHYGRVAFALSTLTLGTVLALIPPVSTKFIVDFVLGDKPVPESVTNLISLPTDKRMLLFIVVLGVMAVSVAKILLNISGRWQATKTTKRLQMTMRRRVFEHAVRLPLYRVQELKSGGVSSILREDAGSIGELVFGMLYNPWRAIVQLVGSLFVLAWVDWRLLVGAVVLLPVVFFTHRTWIQRIRPQFRAIRKQREKIDGQSTETFGGMRVVRAFSRQRREANRFMRENHMMARQELFAWWWSRTIDIVWQTLIPLGSAAIMLYGGLQVLNGSLTLGDLMMFTVYLLMLLEPLGVLAQSATAFQNSLSALDRVLDLLDEPREMQPGENSVNLNRHEVRGAISFENVSFQYPQSEQFALQDISLDLKGDTTIALVGPSGSGKTTLCNLVARFYDPTKGRVLLDGRDLRDVDVENYRSLLGVVEQDVFLFDGTIAENISYADRHASLERIREAADIANASEFIDKLPDGLNSIIGERGVKLSGGQRQRLAIARAVLANPRILILDEATSNLDSESERLIQSSLTQLMRGRTSFVIAHRLSTIAHADQIIVLENSRVIQTGTHSELMQRGGRYSDMVKLQTSPPPPEDKDEAMPVTSGHST